VGGGSVRQADVRVIAASNQSLDEQAAAGQFRHDLFYRLKLMHVRVPPLRERHGDARVLAEHFMHTASGRFDKPVKVFAIDTLSWFDQYAWPGNVRELEHLVYREFLLSDDTQLCIPPPADGQLTLSTYGSVPTYKQAKAAAIEAFERQFLTTLMARSRGCISDAARLVHTERRHLGKLLKRYGIDHVRLRA
jgi:two-component system response regulator GlrR